MTTDVAADGSAPIQQSPTERAREVLDQQINARRAPGMRTDLAFDNDKSVFVGDAIRAMIEFASQAAQPAEADGWVMVPREPTAEMVAAGKKAGMWGDGLTFANYVWEKMLAATPKAPATDAGEVEAFATAQADHWLEDMQTPALGAKHVSLKAMALNCINYGRALATPPAPNDNLRAALEEEGPVPNVSLCTWEVAGPWWQRRARKLERAIDRALKENRRG